MRRGKKRALLEVVRCVERLAVIVGDPVAARTMELARVRMKLAEIRESLQPRVVVPSRHECFVDAGKCYECGLMFADLIEHRKVKHGLP